MRLIFVRHGEPNYQKDCLTENGVEQAKSTAERLAEEPISAIYASPMGRAVETASYTAKDHGLDVQILDFMHEINWGAVPEAEEKLRNGTAGGTDSEAERAARESLIACGGHPWTLGHRLLTDYPEYVGSADWAEHPYFRDNICLQYYDGIAKGIDAFLERYGLYRKNGLYECREDRDDTVAIFAHGGSGAIVFSHVLNLPLPFVLTTMAYATCSVSIFVFRPADGSMVVPRLELFNDTGHIRKEYNEKLVFEK